MRSLWVMGGAHALELELQHRAGDMGRVWSLAGCCQRDPRASPHQYMAAFISGLGSERKTPVHGAAPDRTGPHRAAPGRMGLGMGHWHWGPSKKNTRGKGGGGQARVAGCYLLFAAFCIGVGPTTSSNNNSHRHDERRALLLLRPALALAAWLLGTWDLGSGSASSFVLRRPSSFKSLVLVLAAGRFVLSCLLLGFIKALQVVLGRDLGRRSGPSPKKSCSALLHCTPFPVQLTPHCRRGCLPSHQYLKASVS
jgi:hypothetical protein